MLFTCLRMWIRSKDTRSIFFNRNVPFAWHKYFKSHFLPLQRGCSLIHVSMGGIFPQFQICGKLLNESRGYNAVLMDFRLRDAQHGLNFISLPGTRISFPSLDADGVYKISHSLWCAPPPPPLRMNREIHR